MDDFSEDTCAWVEINVACPKFRWVLNRRIFHSNFGAGSHLERFYTWEGIYLFHCGVSSAKAYGHLLRDIRVRRHLGVFLQVKMWKQDAPILLYLRLLFLELDGTSSENQRVRS